MKVKFGDPNGIYSHGKSVIVEETSNSEKSKILMLKVARKLSEKLKPTANLN